MGSYKANEVNFIELKNIFKNKSSYFANNFKICKFTTTVAISSILWYREFESRLQDNKFCCYRRVKNEWLLNVSWIYKLSKKWWHEQIVPNCSLKNWTNKIRGKWNPPLTKYYFDFLQSEKFKEFFRCPSSEIRKKKERENEKIGRQRNEIR